MFRARRRCAESSCNIQLGNAETDDTGKCEGLQIEEALVQDFQETVQVGRREVKAYQTKCKL